MGYFNHVVYQYDTKTKKTRSYEVGSVGGHISRNFLVDARGHVFVPRPVVNPDDETSYQGMLIELNTNLEPIGETNLFHYPVTPDFDSHGIIAFTCMNDGRIMFATSKGFLYEVITPKTSDAAEVGPVGWFHPEGESYASSLFTYSGERYLFGQARNSAGKIEWVQHDLEEGVSQVISGFDGQQYLETDRLLLYGTHTRDNEGNSYVVGRAQAEDRNAKVPIVLKVSFGKKLQSN